MDPYKIPAASISESTLQHIATSSPRAAEEVRRLANLLDTGEETTADLIALCNVLAENGENEIAEQLLRCNVVDENDLIYQAYRNRYGNHADLVLADAVDRFASQFGVNFHTAQLAFLSHKYTTVPKAVPHNINPEIRPFLSDLCQVDFTYDPAGSKADVYSITDPPRVSGYLLLRFNEGRWELERIGR